MKRFNAVIAFLFILIIVLVTEIAHQKPQLDLNLPVPTIQPIPSSSILGEHIGTRTKTADCQVNGSLPDIACTPGALFSTAGKDQICTSGYTKQVRNVPDSLKNQVYQEYNIYSHQLGEYEVDHLIPLELGGSNDISNLWPEAAAPTPGAHQKDQVENYLHDQVCNHGMDLAQAQFQIATDWLAVYRQIKP